MPLLRPLPFAIAFCLSASLGVSAALAQNFVEVTDPTNPIVTDPGTPNTYNGASWIDYDSDGLPDLFVGLLGLYHNLGGGHFEKVPDAQGPALIASLGHTWADYDNDGDPDVFLAGNITAAMTGGSFLLRNDRTAGNPPGAGPFTAVLVGAMGDTPANGGWAASWGDYDDDGRVDLVVAGLTGFATSPSNHLLHNLGGDFFEHDTTTQVDNFTAPFTVPSWSDYDQDGDLDLFIGSGPATGALGPDYCFQNSTIGAPGATRLDLLGGPPFTTNRDGQIWNWIDYDNDGDLDVYITNYGGFAPGLANDLYRNDAGTLVKQASAAVGVIVSDRGLSLSSVWDDFDNDADLDCFVTNDGGGRARFYRNDVDSTGLFTAVPIGTPTTGLTGESGPHRGACAADYDLDGDEDLFVSGPNATRGLFRNESVNGCHWVGFRLQGTTSNRSAIGARIHMLATIKGQPRWQLREISAQNSFNGQNDLIAHFGMREAALIESVRVEWPSGLVEEAGGGPADRVYTLIEGQLGPTPTRIAFAQASITADGAVRLLWSGALDPGVRATVERSEDAAEWRGLGDLSGGAGGTWLFEDPGAEAGRRYAYRLECFGPDGSTSTTAPVWVDVPGAGPIAFGFASVPASPTLLSSGARFVLGLGRSGVTAARFDLVAASGRAVWSQEVAPAAGARSVTLSVPTAGLTPGVYWAQLRRGPERAVRKLVLVR